MNDVIKKIFFISPLYWTILVLLPMFVGDIIGVEVLFAVGCFFIAAWEILLLKWMDEKLANEKPSKWMSYNLCFFWTVNLISTSAISTEQINGIPEGKASFSFVILAFGLFMLWRFICSILLAQRFNKVMKSMKQEDPNSNSKYLLMFLITVIGIYFIHLKVMDVERKKY